MSEWKQIDDRFEFSVWFMRAIVEPRGDDRYVWHLAGDDTGHRLTDMSDEMPLGPAKAAAEDALRGLWIAGNNVFRKSLRWVAGPAGSHLTHVATFGRWRLEVSRGGWWEVLFCKENGRTCADADAGDGRARDEVEAMRQAEAQLSSLGVAFRSELVR